MAELTHEYLAKKKQAYVDEIIRLDGAIAALVELENELFPQDALTLDEFAQSVGAKSAEIIANAD